MLGNTFSNAADALVSETLLPIVDPYQTTSGISAEIASSIPFAATGGLFPLSEKLSSA